MWLVRNVRSTTLMKWCPSINWQFHREVLSTLLTKCFPTFVSGMLHFQTFFPSLFYSPIHILLMTKAAAGRFLFEKPSVGNFAANSRFLFFFYNGGLLCLICMTIAICSNCLEHVQERKWLHNPLTSFHPDLPHWWRKKPIKLIIYGGKNAALEQSSVRNRGVPRKRPPGWDGIAGIYVQLKKKATTFGGLMVESWEDAFSGHYFLWYGVVKTV